MVEYRHEHRHCKTCGKSIEKKNNSDYNYIFAICGNCISIVALATKEGDNGARKNR